MRDVEQISPSSKLADGVKNSPDALAAYSRIFAGTATQRLLPGRPHSGSCRDVHTAACRDVQRSTRGICTSPGVGMLTELCILGRAGGVATLTIMLFRSSTAAGHSLTSSA